jgi:hypothetical protein
MGLNKKKYLNDIRWETNQLVRQNADIASENIVPKSNTSDFPSEAITVRIKSAKRQNATVYFYGEEKTRVYGGTHKWTYVEDKLKVQLPMSGPSPSRRKYSYSFQGQLPKKWSLYEMTLALEHIQSTFDEMVGADNKKYTGQLPLAKGSRLVTA